MWLIVDTLMLAPFVAIFTILCFLPENIAIVYPICFASIFSSFGCIYLAAYICTSVQTTYRAQALEKQKTYYKDRLQDEERVRQIYHDMKNHLLVLQSQSENSPVLHQAAQTLQDQLQAYESYQHTGNEYLDAIIRDKAGWPGKSPLTLPRSSILKPVTSWTLWISARFSEMPWTTPSKPVCNFQTHSAW